MKKLTGGDKIVCRTMTDVNKVENSTIQIKKLTGGDKIVCRHSTDGKIENSWKEILYC